MANEFKVKKGLIVDGNSTLNGSVTAGSGSSTLDVGNNIVNIYNDLVVSNSISSPNISADNLYVGNSSIHFYNGAEISSLTIGPVTANENRVVISDLKTDNPITVQDQLLFNSDSSCIETTQLTALSGDYTAGLYAGGYKLSPNNTRLKNIGMGYEKVLNSANNMWHCCMNSTGQYQLVATLNLEHVYRSRDYGKTWIDIESVIPGSDAFNGSDMSADGKYQFLLNHDSGGLLLDISEDYGETWSARSIASNDNYAGCIRVSEDGKIVYTLAAGTGDGSGLWRSMDYGRTFTRLHYDTGFNSGGGDGLGTSGNGRYVTWAKKAAANDYVVVARSDDYGTTFVEVLTSALQGPSVANPYSFFPSIVMSSDGKYQLAGEAKANSGNPIDGNFYASYDYGLTWTKRSIDPVYDTTAGVYNVGMSYDGKNCFAALNPPSPPGGVRVYTSYDHGNTWTFSGLSTAANILEIESSADSKYVLLAGYQSGAWLSVADEEIEGNLTVTNSISSPSISADNLYVGNSSIHFYNGTIISSPIANEVNIANNLTVNTSISSPSISAGYFNVNDIYSLTPSNTSIRVHNNLDMMGYSICGVGENSIYFTNGVSLGAPSGNFTFTNVSSGATELTISDGVSGITFTSETITITNPVTAAEWLRVNINGINKVIRLYDYTS